VGVSEGCEAKKKRSKKKTAAARVISLNNKVRGVLKKKGGGTAGKQAKIKPPISDAMLPSKTNENPFDRIGGRERIYR